MHLLLRHRLPLVFWKPDRAFGPGLCRTALAQEVTMMDFQMKQTAKNAYRQLVSSMTNLCIVPSVKVPLIFLLQDTTKTVPVQMDTMMIFPHKTNAKSAKLTIVESVIPLILVSSVSAPKIKNLQGMKPHVSARTIIMTYFRSKNNVKDAQ